jgi:Sec-independent protein translocase protein TatA
MPATTQAFKETYAFLEQNIPDGFYCENFDETLTRALYKYLSYHFDKEALIQERPNIRKAIKSYFSLYNQHISVLFKGLDAIVIKDLKKNIYGENSEQFHIMSQYLASLIYKIDSFKVNDGVYMIPKDELIKAGCDFENISDEGLKKELYRESAKVAFELDGKDLVFFVNEKLTIKKFISSAQGAERRAYGLPTEELEKLKNIIFEKNVQEEIAQAIMLLSKTSVNFSSISNDYFRKNAITLTQDALYRVASIFLNEDAHVALKKAFVNYIFRENFIQIHQYFAQELIELHALRDKNAEQFLRFFDGKIEVIDGRQVQKPDIIDSKNQRWNAVSILPIAIGKIRSDKEILTLKETLQKASTKIAELTSKTGLLDKEFGGLKGQKEEIEEAIYEVIQESKELQERNYNLKKKRNKHPLSTSEQEEMNDLVIEIRKYSKEEDRLRKLGRDTNSALEIIKTKLKNLNTEIQIQERYINEQHKKIDNLTQTYAPINEKYELIINAVAKTLTIKY